MASEGNTIEGELASDQTLGEVDAERELDLGASENKDFPVGSDDDVASPKDHQHQEEEEEVATESITQVERNRNDDGHVLRSALKVSGVVVVIAIAFFVAKKLKQT